MEKITTFGERLKKTMQMKNVDANYLQEITGINSSLIYRYEKGLVEPRQPKIDLIAKALGVNTLWIMGYDCTHEIVSENRTNIFNQINGILNNCTEDELSKILVFLETFMNK